MVAAERLGWMLEVAMPYGDGSHTAWISDERRIILGWGRARTEEQAVQRALNQARERTQDRAVLELRALELAYFPS